MAGGFLRNGYFLRRLSLFRTITYSTASGAARSGTITPAIQKNHPHYRIYSPYRLLFNKPKDFGVSPSRFYCSSCSSLSSSSEAGLVGWYLGMIKARPILIKSLTTSFIYTAADLSSQIIARPSSEPFDLVRTLRMAGFGLVILGPSLHLWFNFVSRVFPKRDVIATLKKIVMAQTLYGPAMTAVFFTINAGLQGENGSEITARLKRDLLPTMLNGVMYWPFCDFVTYKFFPVQLQPLVSNSFSYLWTVYMTYMASLEKPKPN